MPAVNTRTRTKLALQDLKQRARQDVVEAQRARIEKQRMAWKKTPEKKQQIRDASEKVYLRHPEEYLA